MRLNQRTAQTSFVGDGMTVPMRVTYKLHLALGLGGAFAAAATLGGVLAACSSGSANSNGDGGSNASATSCTMTDALIMKFSPVYSAYEPNHMYAVPVVVNTMNATLTASDMTAVGIQQNADLSQNGFTGWTLTILSAPSGPVTLTAQVGNYCTTAQLMVTAATSDDWEIGNQRYNNGASLHLPMFGGRGGGDGGPPPMMMAPMTSGGSPFETADGGPACTNCHGVTATMGFLDDIAHTPEQTGGFSDEDLVNIIVHGVVPDGGYFDPNIISMTNWHGIHQWSDIMQDQYRGMVVYLRSLTPVAQMGHANLGGFINGMRDAGGGG